MAPRYDPRLVAAAIIGAVLLGALLAWLTPLPDYGESSPACGGDPDPAAYQVGEVLEEARRITREASGDDAR